MATNQATLTHDEAIKIVELALPKELRAGPISSPQLTYRGGPLLSSVEVFTIFWGPRWNKAPQSTMIDQINSFFDDILTSPLIDQLAEYNVPAYSIGHGTRIGTVTLTKPRLGKVVSDTTIGHMLTKNAKAGGELPPPTPNTLYFVYLEPGVAVVQGGGRSCQVFCGYHNDLKGEIFYAVMPYPGCNGCTGGLQPFDALTSTSSHELCEAITDPIPGQGWYDEANGEIGDICAWQTKTVGQYTVQLEWSNAQNQCV